nr:immunoglobulin light chain junction region [Macaca mulatta]MOY09727.1 immunoglobulin light chain junction region [Macaca mulatta]
DYYCMIWHHNTWVF